MRPVSFPFLDVREKYRSATGSGSFVDASPGSGEAFKAASVYNCLNRASYLGGVLADE